MHPIERFDRVFLFMMELSMLPEHQPSRLRDLEREVSSHPAMTWMQDWSLRLRILTVRHAHIVARVDVWPETIKPERHETFLRTDVALAREVAHYIEAFLPFPCRWTIGVRLRSIDELPHDPILDPFTVHEAAHLANVELLCTINEVDVPHARCRTIVQGGGGGRYARPGQ